MYVFVKDGIIIILHLYGTQNKCYILMFIYITENLQEVVNKDFARDSTNFNISQISLL